MSRTSERPPNFKDDVYCYNPDWTGIDGFSAPGEDILQAGIDLVVEREAATTNATLRAWLEWWQGHSVYIDNVPINPRDVISCHISCPVGGNTGTVYMINKASGLHVSIPAQAPAGTV